MSAASYASTDAASGPSTPARWPWHAAVALLAAGLAIALLADARRGARTANLDLGDSALPAAYLMHHGVESGVGYLVERRASTLRRADRGQPGGKRRVLPLHLGDGAGVGYVLVAKRYPTVLLVPIAAVEDWSYPFVHGLIAAQHPEWPLATLTLRRLYVDRVFRGVYLQVELPHDKRKKDGGSGERRLLLAVEGARASRLSTRWDDGPGALIDKLAIGRFPQLAPAPPAVAWLATVAGGADTTVVLDPGEDGVGRLSPLPLSLAALYQAAHGRAPAHVEDARFGDLRAAASATVALPAPDAATRARRDAAYAAYLRALVAGLRLQAAAEGAPAPDAAAIAARLQAASRLGLRPGLGGGA